LGAFLRNLQASVRNLRQFQRNLSQAIRWKPRPVMATFNKFNSVAALPWNNGLNLASDALKVMLSNTPPVATNQVYSDVSGGEVANGNGYLTGGAAVTTISSLQSSGLWILLASCANPTWSATGAVGAFRYVLLYDNTATTPLNKPLLGWWDYGSTVNMQNGDTFTVQLDAVNGVLQMS
jgi:hypothetical protein